MGSTFDYIMGRDKKPTPTAQPAQQPTQVAQPAQQQTPTAQPAQQPQQWLSPLEPTQAAESIFDDIKRAL